LDNKVNVAARKKQAGVLIPGFFISFSLSADETA
jgi:hypothetical protein